MVTKYRRTRNLFDPKSIKPYRLSRSRLENFIKCPRCFYLDRKLGVEPPGMPPFTLNSAVDKLLKAEFDQYRASGKPHPIMEAYGIDAVPYKSFKMNEWRENFKGVQHHHEKTNLIIFGAVDDLWVDKEGKIFVVDYKATSINGKVSIDTESRKSFKRQMEIYQWLLRRQGLEISNTAYFVYCNADKNKENFDSKLDFFVEVIPYEANDGWVEEKIISAHKCLLDKELPDYSDACGYCQYRKVAHNMEHEEGYLQAQEEFLF